VLVMKLHPTGIVVIALGLLAGAVVETNAAEPPPGAGPILLGASPCLIANKTGRGTPCPEPEVSDSGDKKVRANAHFRRALFFIEMQEMPKARSEIDQALEIDPGWAEPRHLSARLAMATADVQRAESDIAIALKLAPDDMDVRATSAAILEWRSPREALVEFDNIASAAPTHIYSRGQRARLLVQLGQPGAAMGDLDFLLNGDQPATEYLTLRAAASLQLGHPLDAVADYNAALKVEPGQLSVLIARAAVFVLAGDDASALRDYDTILGPVGSERPPYAIGGEQLAFPLMERAKILVRGKRFTDAAADIARAIQIGGKNAVLKAQLFLRRNNFSDTPIDGRDSRQLREALKSCFALNSCFQGMMREI
jgi:tetratricopeptide (TPR) repeat protein